ncbi:MAG: hypothetical protein H9535_00520 [Ignavibacteria bacterium]|nr:hypothetical protein [Ignavibacteria bacterium]
MTIQNTSPRNQYTANGVQTVFTYSFEILNQADIKVFIGTTQQTITTHYTVAGVGSETGGTITFLTAPTNGSVVTLLRSTTRARTVDYQQSGAFKSEVVNADFDRLMAIVQELDGVDQLSLKIPSTDATGLTTTLPSATSRASKALIFDASGNITVSADNYVDQLANVTAQAVAAAASASAASTSATNSLNSANASAASAAAAATTLDEFDDRYLGSKSANPTLDNDGAALLTGSLHWNTTDNMLRIWTGSTWNDVAGVTSFTTSGVGISVNATTGNITLTSNATSANTANTIVSRDASGNFSAGVITGTATAARYSDLAEYYTAPAVATGTVVKLATQGSFEVEPTTQAYDTGVFGVVSTKPGFMMNYTPEGSGVPVALAGRVPVRLIGRVARGQRITSSPIEGVAQALSEKMIEERPALLAAVIGRALESKADAGIGLVECVVVAQR